MSAAHGLSSAMAKGPAAASTLETPPPSALKRSTSSTQNMKNQKSILGFFQKSSPTTPSTAKSNGAPASSPAERASEQRATSSTSGKTSKNKKDAKKDPVSSPSGDLTPLPSSDPVEREDNDAVETKVMRSEFRGFVDLFVRCRRPG